METYRGRVQDCNWSSLLGEMKSRLAVLACAFVAGVMVFEAQSCAPADRPLHGDYFPDPRGAGKLEISVQNMQAAENGQEQAALIRVTARNLTDQRIVTGSDEWDFYEGEWTRIEFMLHLVSWSKNNRVLSASYLPSLRVDPQTSTYLEFALPQGTYRYELRMLYAAAKPQP